MKANKIGMMFVTMLLVLFSVAAVSAQTNSTNYLDISHVQINGDDAANGDILYVQRGDNFDIRVTVRAGDNDVENTQIEAYIAGYRYAKYERDLVTDYTKTFDLPADNKRSFNLNLEVPQDMEQKDAKLRIVVSDENSPNIIVYNYQLNIEGAAEGDAIQIRDFLISPSETIEAGRALSFKVKVKNIGESRLDDVTVKVSVPELDIQAYETIDEIDVDETQSFEALLLRIPSCVPAGTYNVVAEVGFDKYEQVTETKQITVKESGSGCGTDSTGTTDTSGRSLVMMPDSIELTKGTSGTIYPILIENQASVSKTYVVSASGVSDFASANFEPSSVVIIKGGESKTVYLKLVPKDDAEAGDKVFKVTLISGDESKETTVVATITAGADDTTNAGSSVPVRTVLEWALIILIIVLIILGLILVFVKMRKNDRDDEDESQTYY